MIDRATFRAVVAEAMLAPSAHNTQPVRWALEGDTIALFADMSRHLPVGDPTGRDLRVSCGAAAEGTALALSARGIGADVGFHEISVSKGLARFADVTPKRVANLADTTLVAYVSRRTTHRAGFSATPPESLTDWHEGHLTLITDPADIDWLARRIDIASARIMRDRAFRAELLGWMRLNRSAPDFGTDGLNRDVLAMDAVSAALTRPVLGTAIYPVLAALGLGPTLAGEAGRTRKAGAIALFHWPLGGSLFEAGRAFYRSWLSATARGLFGWPAAALADDPATRKAVESRFAIPSEHALINALRLGGANGPIPSRARLPIDELIL